MTVRDLIEELQRLQNQGAVVTIETDDGVHIPVIGIVPPNVFGQVFLDY